MKNSKTRSKKNFIIAAFFYLFFINTYSMDVITERYRNLENIYGQIDSDVSTLVNDLCSLSNYLVGFKDLHYLKEPAESRERLSSARSVLKRMTDVIDQLSQDQSSFSQSWLCRTMTHQTADVRKRLLGALKYLDCECFAQLETALAVSDAPSAVKAMQKASYNTELLFTALNNKISFEGFIQHIPCQDENFKSSVEAIVEFLYKPSGTSLIRANKNKKTEMKSFAQKVKKINERVGNILKTVDEVADKPDLSGLALMFLNPSFAVKKGVPLVESSPWLRGQLGGLGKDIENAMKQDMAPSKLMQLTQAKVPPQVKPLVISILANYGKTIVNPLVWMINKVCLSPVRYVTNKVETVTQDLINQSSLPVLEQQLSIYLSKLGESFNSLVQAERADSRKNTTLIEKWEKFIKKHEDIEDDSVLLHKYDKKRKKFKNIEKIRSYLEEGSERSKKADDTHVALGKKLKILEGILEKREYQISDIQSKSSLNLKQSDLKLLTKNIKEKKKQILKRENNLKHKLNQCEQDIEKRVHILSDMKKNGGFLCYLPSDFKNRMKLINDELENLEAKKEKLQQKIKNSEAHNKAEMDKYEHILQNKLLHKARLHLLRDFLQMDYLQDISNDPTLSNESKCYFQELVLTNYKEFHKVIKRFYKKNSSLDQEEAQNIFNAWFIYLLDRQKDYNKEKLKTGYEEILDQIEKAKNETEAECESYSKKHIREVWSSYTLSMRVAAWFNFLRKGRFPIYTTQYKTMIKSHESLYQQCFEKYQSLKNKGSFKFLQEADQSQTLLHIRQEQRVRYNLIKFLLYDDEKVITSVENVKAIQPIKIQGAIEHELQKEYKIEPVSVKPQRGAHCGQHAVYNALKSVNKIAMTLEEFLTQSRPIILEAREQNNDYKFIGNDEWLSEEEVNKLLKDYVTPSINEEKQDPVIFLPDVKKYLLGLGGLEHKTIQQLAQVHELIDTKKDFERVYVICTASETNSYNRGGSYDQYHVYERNKAHWIAIKQVSKDGDISYAKMDSSPGWSCKELENNFIKLMHQARGYVSLSEEKLKIREELLGVISWSKAFHDGFYALESIRTQAGKEKITEEVNFGNKSKAQETYKCWIDCIFEEPNPLEIDEISLASRVLAACVALLRETGGEPFSCHMGRIEPIPVIKKVLETLKARDNKSFILHRRLNEPGTEISFQLSEKEKQIIEALEQKINE